MHVGSRSADVTKLQSELIRLGFLPSGWHTSTFYGTATRNAADHYVDANPQDISGLISSLHFGNVNPNVRRLQHDLKALGLLPRGWVITDIFGTHTRAAVAAYLAHHS